MGRRAQTIEKERYEGAFGGELRFTAAHRRNEHAPAPLREARCRAAVLTDLLLPIGDGTLVGAIRRPAVGFSEIAGYYCDTESVTDYIERSDVCEDEEQRLCRMVEYWRGKTTAEVVSAAFSFEPGGPAVSNWRVGGAMVDFAEFLKLGVGGCRRKVQAGLEASGADADRRAYYESLCIACDMLSATAEFYAQQASSAAVGRDAERREELDEVSRICRRVAVDPPDTFHEAAQALWFLTIVGEQYNWGRFDQYMFPFYQRDVERGPIAAGDAERVMESLWRKLGSDDTPSYSGKVMVGGVTPDGRDATNPLTRLCLDMTAKLRQPLPQVVLRCHPGGPDTLLRKGCRMLRAGMANPVLFNDATAERTFTRRGIPLEVARDYVVCDCGELSLGGKSYSGPDPIVHAIRCLELALRDGLSPATGKRMGPSTGKPSSFRTFEDLTAAFKKQTAHFIAQAVADSNTSDALRAQSGAYLFRSLLIDGCVEKGLSLFRGGARYNSFSVEFHGLTNVYDSLASIKKLVFDEKLMSLAEFVSILDANWEGNESLRIRARDDVPKFGNDDETVDAIAREVAEYCTQEVKKHRAEVRGGDVVSENVSGGSQVGLGKTTGATADGRRAGDVTANSIGPTAGRDTHGPTACIRSVTKLDHSWFDGGTVLNMKFSPSALAGDEGLEKLTGLVKTYFRLGGMQVQITAVEKDALIKARETPEEYRDLLVRVGGFSARFVYLDPDTQQEIIDRTEH